MWNDCGAAGGCGGAIRNDSLLTLWVGTRTGINTMARGVQRSARADVGYVLLAVSLPDLWCFVFFAWALYIAVVPHCAVLSYRVHCRGGTILCRFVVSHWCCGATLCRFVVSRRPIHCCGTTLWCRFVVSRGPIHCYGTTLWCRFVVSRRPIHCCGTTLCHFLVSRSLCGNPGYSRLYGVSVLQPCVWKSKVNMVLNVHRNHKAY